MIENLNHDFFKYIFPKGFLITSKEVDSFDKLSYLNKWKKIKFSKFNFYLHPKTKFTYFEENNNIFFIIGNAINPFTNEYEESAILKDISKNKNNIINKLNELTGVFLFGNINNDAINIISDASGLQPTYYGTINDILHITSHPQLVRDLYNLELSPYVLNLTKYKLYGRVMGPYLPADISPVSELKRVIANFYYSYNGIVLEHQRIFPTKEIPVSKNTDYDKIILTASDILKNTMKLIAEKWETPQISLTGGVDSTTTFAAAKGIYNRYKTFSYVSAEKEVEDANVAKYISEKFGVNHKIYNIPIDEELIEDFEIFKLIFDHNSGYVHPLRDNELRKKIFFIKNSDIEVEVKSWTSEIIRGRWYGHFGKNKLPNISNKLFRNVYKMFIFNRILARETDKVFSDFIVDYDYDKIYNIPSTDMFYWEITMGAWGGVNLQEMNIYHDHIVPFNNRKLLEMLFQVPLNKRINDVHHNDLKKHMNKDLYDMNILVDNVNTSKFHKLIFYIIFKLNMIVPF